MGLPTSWAILSLIHLFWMDEARKASRFLRQECRFHIMGDDALLLTNHRGAEAYKNIVRVCGGEPSKGKHFESKGLTLRGVFLERLYEMRREGDRIT